MDPMMIGHLLQLVQLANAQRDEILRENTALLARIRILNEKIDRLTNSTVELPMKKME